jgi:peptidoglycan/xylan/chitin deacetylase (PgdA/CDA1 family)
VLITFDDGYKSAYSLCYPILRKYDIPAAVFCPGDILDDDNTGAMIWVDTLAYLLGRTGSNCVVLNDLGPSTFDITSVNNRRIVFDYLVGAMRAMDRRQRTELLEELSDTLEVKIGESVRSELYISRDELREMAGNGITFGCHTMSHPDFSHLADMEIEEEINESRRAIERITEEKCRFFAYPFGDECTFSEKTRSILDNCDFEAAFTTKAGLNDFSDDPLELKRIIIPRGAFSGFEFHTLGIASSIKSLLNV